MSQNKESGGHNHDGEKDKLWVMTDKLWVMTDKLWVMNDELISKIAWWVMSNAW